MWLSLDLSSKTGWAVWDAQKLQDFGLIVESIPDLKHNKRSYSDLSPRYPQNYIDCIDRLLAKLELIFDKYPISLIVIEHTEGSSFRFSQKYLEWLHFAFWTKFSSKYRLKYLLNKDWRQATDCYIKCWPEFEQHNKLHSKLKKKLKSSVVKHEGKRIGRVDQKKLSVHIANILIESINMKTISDDNIADAINLGQAAICLLPGLLNDSSLD